MTPANQFAGPNAREAEYWNSAATRAWANRHEPIDALFAGLTQVALDQAAPQHGEHVLDVGCGSGTTLLELAAAWARAAMCSAPTFRAGLVDRARERIAVPSCPRRSVLADVSTHAFAPKV